MAKKVMNEELAKTEVQKWLEHKRVKPRKIESNEASIEELENGFADGSLVLNPETHEIDLHLLFPIGDNVNKLTFKPRINVGQVHQRLREVKTGDVDGRIKAYISTLTNQPTNIIGSMDTEDYNLASSIAIFFF